MKQQCYWYLACVEDGGVCMVARSASARAAGGPAGRAIRDGDGGPLRVGGRGRTGWGAHRHADTAAPTQPEEDIPGSSSSCGWVRSALGCSETANMKANMT